MSILTHASPGDLEIIHATMLLIILGRGLVGAGGAKWHRVNSVTIYNRRSKVWPHIQFSHQKHDNLSYHALL